MVHTHRTFGLALAALALFVGLFPAARATAAGVVGTGTPASCTRDALAAAMADGGRVTFNCGAAPATIAIPAAIEVRNTVEVDGGGMITLQGSGRVFYHRSYATSASALTLANLTIAGSRISGAGETANGAAILSVNNSIDGKTYIPTLTLDRVTIRDNDTTLTSFDSSRGLNAYDFGGAVYSQGGALIIRNSTFTGNDANNAAGGAVHVLQSTLLIQGSTFADNTAIGSVPANSQGGAIYIDGVGGASGSARISASQFTSNRSYNAGGAIYVNLYENSNQFVVEQSSFEQNAIVGGAGALGGAIAGGSTSLGMATTGNASIRISESLFAANSVKKTRTANEDGSGGALAFAQPAVIQIVNTTFAGNSALGSSFNANGGALYVVNNTVPFSIVNSTFANNNAGWVGGAISNSQIRGQPGGSVTNTLFFQNSADNGPNDWNIQQHCSSELVGSNNLQYPPRLTGSNFANDVTCFQGKSAPNQANDPAFRDPQLLPPGDNGGPTSTMAIPVSSPARDGGTTAGCPSSDQRGVGRPQGASCDIGAFELVAALRVYPTLLEVGSRAPVLTVEGAGFGPSSVVLWNGAPRQTAFVDAQTLRVTLSDADTARTGTATVQVQGVDLPPVSVSITAKVQRANLPLIRR